MARDESTDTPRGINQIVQDARIAWIGSEALSARERAEAEDSALVDEDAIRVAQVELVNGQNQEFKCLAQSIIDAQSREIEQMNRRREQWYGSPSPAGGVPMMQDGGMPSHEDMGH